jgi:hypothetical protein
MRLNLNVKKLKVGDAVTSDYLQTNSKEIFYITEIVENTKPLTKKQRLALWPYGKDTRPQYKFGSGRGIKAESKPCACCHRDGRSLQPDNNFIDAAWVSPA